MGSAASLRGDAAQDDGFGLVEVVISMFLLAVIATAAIPVLLQGAKLSARNSAMATATQLASQDVEAARAAATACSALRSFSRASVPERTDVRGNTYTITRTAVTCPILFPAVVSFTSSVSWRDDELASIATRILVTS
jgi:prepilin-type N-terminal cleavage/methylation domain-containing protein